MTPAARIQQQILKAGYIPNGVKSWFFGNFEPSRNFGTAKDALNPWSYVSPIQFYREKIDLQTWRDAVEEMENQILPYRVICQKIFLDTSLNDHVTACVGKRKDQILMKDFEIKYGDKVDEQITKILKKPWFNQLMSYILDADDYGYTLVGLGPMYNFTFPKMRVVRRENISPDRLCVSPVVYSPNGWIHFMDPASKDSNGRSFSDWTIYADTPNETGQSVCGYGRFYKIAQLDIYLRNNRGDNATYNEMFGMPFRELKMDSNDAKVIASAEERLRSSGANGYMISPQDSELNFHNQQGGANGYKSYESFEGRLQKGISKIILGHADAMESKPGKLGAQSVDVQEALQAKETTDMKRITDFLQTTVFPKLQKIGFPIKPGAEICFKNDKEEQEEKTRKNKANADFIDQVVKLAQAGYKMDPKFIEDETGIKVKEIEKQEAANPFIDKETQEAIKNIYRNV